MNPLLSIIVPVYNVENFLPKCLDSILKQSFDCFECILIDDGSTDNSGSICDEYVNRDNRFKVFHKNNSGRSNARNFGIDNSIGKYITFVDSDDYIDENTYFSVFEVINREKVDACCFGINRFSNNSIVSEVKFHDKGLTKNFINSDVYMHSVCNKVFNRKIVDSNNIRFDSDLTVCEDMLFTLKVLAFCRKVYYLNKNFYYYRFNELSESKITYSEVELRDYKVSYDRLNLFCEQNGFVKRFNKFLKYRELYYSIQYLINPKYYAPNEYRHNRSRFNYWTYTFRPDLFLVTFCSAIHFDLPAKLYTTLKNKVK